MKGDIIITEEHHHRAAKIIVDKILPEILSKPGRYTITVAGESGSGKSETGQAIAEALAAKSVPAGIYQQDDYFVYPPKTNHITRARNISWVGPQEVKLDLLDEHLLAAQSGRDEVIKPLVLFVEDEVTEETMSLVGLKVVIAEGTYTSLLKNVDTKVFVARNRLETLESRKKRGREAMDPFIEEVLKIEHEIISKHRDIVDIVITRDYDVEFVRKVESEPH